ncbi:MAG: LamG-like jellyroll fold domain-containing protein [Planctomycetota bacterium]|jgi:hypothetical protein|nr:LamG-like jellyroll fold domain-containing protein [Planctomycetota bacterium]
MNIQNCLGFLLLFGVVLSPAVKAQELDLNRKNLTFLATFDKSLNADYGLGEIKQFRAEDVSRKKVEPEKPIEGVSAYPQGKFGGAIDFKKKTKNTFCYKAAKNFPYSKKEFDVTITFWMKTDPTQLPKGFIDPLQITDKKWNDASIFVDFNDQRPADFRLGVFSDLKFWNPDNRDFNKMKPEDRPMIDAGKVKFDQDQWMHVGLVLDDLNTDGKTSLCEFYLDGRRVGQLARKQKFTWEINNAYIMLGIYFIGQIDDFAIFDKALTADQIQAIAKAPDSISTILK